MYKLDGRLILSASDLTGFLACRHLTQLDLTVARGELEEPHRPDPLLDMISRLGLEHETNYLQELKAEGLAVAVVGESEHSVDSLQQRATETFEALKSGIDLIYQATFFDGTWRGHADFLRKVDIPSDLGAYSYEVWDTKLARRAKAAAVLQICAYSEHVERLQGRYPDNAHLLLGDQSIQSFKLRDYVAYYRAVKAQFEDALESSSLASYPEPVDHCKICKWLPVCNSRRRADRHLTFVADMRKDQAKKLVAADVSTIDALAASSPSREVAGLSQTNFVRLQDQASLQVEREATGEHRYKLLPPPGPGLGLEGLPEPSSGDLFFDIESDVYAADGGLEYLFGWVDAVDDFSFRHSWAHDPASEKQMFESFVDSMIERLDSYPAMHVYHYSPYEPSALKRLMSRYGTREDAVDRLLRAQVFVDLFRLVKQSMRISEESYSIKSLEVFYDFARTDEITEAGSSMVEYERYRDTGDPSILEEIRIYNEADCRSLVGLRDWLEERRTELEKTAGELRRPPIMDGRQGTEAEEERTEIFELMEALTVGISIDPGERSSTEQSQWLLAQLLEWHRREEKSDWWAYYDRQKQSALQLLEDRETLSVLSFDQVDGEVKRSDLFRYSFADQETKLDSGDSVVDAHTGANSGTLWDIDFQNHKVWLKRGKGWEGRHPEAIGPGAPPKTNSHKEALRRIAMEVIAHGCEKSTSYRAAIGLLSRADPDISRAVRGQSLLATGEPSDQAARRLVVDLNESYLAIQGPPGTGKTHTGARMIVDQISAGKRVGVTANSHKVISNLLDGVCSAASEEGVGFKGVQKCSGGEGCDSDLIESEKDNVKFDHKVLGGEYQLVAGTSWALTRPALDQKLDVLFIDEAGQFSLANTMAVATCAKNLVLLGDPQQLNQPTKGVHPEGTDESGLSHVLAGAETISPHRGLFLERTFRMHPALTRYVSDAFYDGRLEAVEGRDRQVVHDALPPGIHLHGVVHEGNRIFSWEEAEAIAEIARGLIGQEWTNDRSETKTLTPDDIVVVAPFNAQVARIRQLVPKGVPVGTVDKFQGQEGVVAIYSMTTSSPEDIPRNFEFLYSRNRLNVAVSRARSFALVVCNPAMLLPMCRKPEHMRLANALCLLAEYADGRAATKNG